MCQTAGLNTHILFDTLNNTADVKNWRDTSMILSASQNHVSTIGLDDFWMSGSGAVSAAGFSTILQNVKRITEGKVRNCVIVDLRAETHGYLNGDSISLKAPNNWINVGKTKEQIFHEEQLWLQTLNKKFYVCNILTGNQYKFKNFSDGVRKQVHSVMSEGRIVKALGMDYLRLHVNDHSRPSDSIVSEFVSFVKNLAADTWVHMHCLAGKGRTTTFMILYDILRNGNRVSFNEILSRQAIVNPHYNLFHINDRNPDLYFGYLQRLNFLKKFYDLYRSSNGTMCVQGYQVY